MSSKNTSRPNTPTEQNKEDNTLVLYRLEKVEEAVKDMTKIISGMQNVTKADLQEFGARVIERFDEKSRNLQEQIDEKADHKTADERWGYVKAGFTTITAGVVTFLVWFVTVGND